MLVTSQRPLETRCPIWWSTGVGAAALSLVVVAATFGGRTETRAAPAEVAAIEHAAEPITTRDETAVEGTSPASTIEVATVDPAVQERETIVARLLARPKLPPYIHIHSIGEMRFARSGEKHHEEQTDALVGRESWRVQTTAPLPTNDRNSRWKVTTRWFQAGMVWAITGEKGANGTLNIGHIESRKPTAAEIEEGAALPQSLIYPFFAAVRTFIERNADKARVGSPAKETELELRTVEWDVTEESDIRKIFVLADGDAFRDGGTLRLFVVPQWNYAVTRIEHVERSGKSQATIDAIQFEERWPGVHIPREIRVRSDESDIKLAIDVIEPLDRETADELIAIEASKLGRNGVPFRLDVELTQGAAAVEKEERSEPRLPPFVSTNLPEKTEESTTASVKTAGEKSIDPADVPKQKIIDGLLARERGIASGVIEYTEVQRQESHANKPIELHVERVFSGVSSYSRITFNSNDPAAPIQMTSLSYNGYFVSLRPVGKAHKFTFHSADQGSVRPWDSPLPRILGLPVELSRISAADLRLVGMETIQGIETQLVEYPVSEGDALAGRLSSADAKPAKTVRLNVAPGFGYAIVRMTRVDQFGLASAIHEYSDFKEVAPGIHIPFKALIQTPGHSSDIRVLKLSEWNRPIAESRFALRLLAGTQVEDLRPHWNDRYPSVTGNAEFDKEAYPLRKFTLLAEEPAGLPSTVLAEMDRDLVPPEEWAKIRRAEEIRERNPARQGAFPVGFTLKKESGAVPLKETVQGKIPSPKVIQQQSAPVDLPGGTAPAKQTPASVATAVIDKEKLRFGGKRFSEWQQTLIHDLDPETRVEALSAIGAFAATPYAEEIVSTIRELLKSHPHDPDPVSGEDVIATSAFRVLGRVGAPAIPLLEEQLANDEVANRRLAMTELSRLAEKTNAVIPALLRATKHENSSLRERALFALVKSHPKAPGVAEAVRNRFDDPDVTHFESQLLEALLTSRDSTIEIPTESLLRLLRSRFARARPLAAALLLSAGPAKEGVGETVKKALLEAELTIRSTFVSWIQNRPTIDAVTTVPILIDLLEWGRYISTAEGARIGPFEEDQVTAMEMKIIEILARLPMEGPARAAIPILVKAADGKLPNTSRAFRLAAIQALGIAGPAAKEAVPVLRLLHDMPGPSPGDADDSPRAELAHAEWRAALESAIRRIEAK